MTHLPSWQCYRCGHKYFSLLGSRFVAVVVKGKAYKRRWCVTCLEYLKRKNEQIDDQERGLK